LDVRIERLGVEKDRRLAKGPKTVKNKGDQETANQKLFHRQDAKAAKKDERRGKSGIEMFLILLSLADLASWR
jgi:hypothetical protein